MPKDLEIARIAARQQGNVTRAQLFDAGFGRDAIAYRIKVGRLHRIHAGVYSVGRPARTAMERASAAVLACGPNAALARIGALALWGFADIDWPASFDVLARSDRRPAGIRVHQSTTLLPRDTRRHLGIRVTSPARTLLDCAPLLSARTLGQAVNAALRTRRLTAAALEDILARNPTHPGAKLLAPLQRTNGNPTRSPFEDDFVAFCGRYALPAPLTNVVVAGHEVDAFFPQERLIVELDGWEFHSDRTSFETDRDRDADTLAAGIPTVRITYERYRSRTEQEAARLQTILAARRTDAA